MFDATTTRATATHPGKMPMQPQTPSFDTVFRREGVARLRLILSPMLAACCIALLCACPISYQQQGGGDDSETPDVGDRDDAGPPIDVDGGRPDPIDAGDLQNRPDAGPPDPAFDGCLGNSVAHETFNAFWSTFNDDYAVFPYRLDGESWASIGAAACPNIDASTTNEELFDILIGMARHLDDAHVKLRAPNLGREETAQVNFYPFADEVEAAEFVVEDAYLGGNDLRWAAEEWFGWGNISTPASAIAYLSITNMNGLETDGVDDEEADVRAASHAMRIALNDLDTSGALILDVRWNAGRWDSVALEIAGFIDGPPATAWTKASRDGPSPDDLGPEATELLPPARPDAFTGPVVVLSSGFTSDAAETFLLAMRARPNVTIFGERSSGHLTSVEDRVLPNGWTLTLSTQRYATAAGEVFESTGVPVDVEADLGPESMRNGQDQMLEAAIDFLQQ